ncbi:MAG: CRTAC1 family protein [Planctomycetota bacterium]
MAASRPTFRSRWRDMEASLAKHPTDDEQRHKLVCLLCDHGYLHRAALHTEYLLRRGTASATEMHFITARRQIPPVENAKRGNAKRGDPTRGIVDRMVSDKDPPLLRSRKALLEGNYAAALDHLRGAYSDGWEHPAHAALAGQILAAEQRWELAGDWLASCPSSVVDHADFWSASARFAMHGKASKLAVCCMLRAFEIDPTSSTDLQLFSRLAPEHFDDVVCTEVQRMLGATRECEVILLLMRSRAHNPEYFDKLKQQQLSLARPFAALRWQELRYLTEVQLAATAGDESMLAARTRQMKLVQRQTGLQRRRLLASADIKDILIDARRLGQSKTSFPTPTLGELRSQMRSLLGPPTNELARVMNPRRGKADTPVQKPASTIRFTDITEDLNLSFQYYNHTPSRFSQIRIHETLGGGIGVLDFDQDGLPDMYLAQGGGNPPKPGSSSSQLFRNSGDAIVDITTPAGVTDCGYTHGVGVGDFNQDGFPDLIAGNLGTNRYWLNQGDGTFIDVGEIFHAGGTRVEGSIEMTTSVVIADLNGDGLADVFEAGYVDDPKTFDLPDPNRPRAANGLSPLQYRPARDRVFLGQPAGDFLASWLTPESDTKASYSLGVLVGEWDGRPGNEVFVSVDALPNRLWKFPGGSSRVTPSIDSKTSELDGRDLAPVLGLALDSRGTATAGMGVSAGDFDGDGRCDLHVTNFSRESSSLFLRNRVGLFEDRSSRWGLDAATLPMVGFGTQSADFDNDGLLDMAILNGHIENFEAFDEPFRMPPQWFRGVRSEDQTRFEAIDVSEFGDFASRRTLGRALATVDWDRDGRVDLIAGHMDAPVALLRNDSTVVGSWVRLSLVGVRDPRDPVGAHVIARPVGTGKQISGRTGKQARGVHRWLTAGGYLTSNEPVLHFATEIRTDAFDVEIHWPSGHVQTLDALDAGREHLVIQSAAADAATPKP